MASRPPRATTMTLIETHETKESADSAANTDAPPLLEVLASTIKTTLPQLLVTWDELPLWLRDNEHIHTGFRPASNSYLVSLHSLTYIHNQTGNIYSHLIAALFTAGLAHHLHAYAAAHYPSAGREDLIVFGVFFVGMMTCYLLSATFHTFGNHSKGGHGLWLRADFLGIIAVTAGAFVPSLWYTAEGDVGGGDCRSRETKSSWIVLDLTAQLLAAIFTLFVPKFRTPLWRPVRAFVFIFMASSGFFPIIYATWTHGVHRAVAEGGATYHALAAFCYLAGVGVYATRWPEKWAPGNYDIWGHSHQLFHVLVVLGLGAHLAAFLTAFDYHHRLGRC